MKQRIFIYIVVLIVLVIFSVMVIAIINLTSTVNNLRSMQDAQTQQSLRTDVVSQTSESAPLVVTQIITGKVERDGNPVSNTTITLVMKAGDSDGESLKTQTDEKGQYKFTDIKPGKYYLLVAITIVGQGQCSTTSPGFSILRANVTNKDSGAAGSISMATGAEQPFEVQAGQQLVKNIMFNCQLGENASFSTSNSPSQTLPASISIPTCKISDSSGMSVLANEIFVDDFSFKVPGGWRIDRSESRLVLAVLDSKQYRVWIFWDSTINKGISSSEPLSTVAKKLQDDDVFGLRFGVGSDITTINGLKAYCYGFANDRESSKGVIIILISQQNIFYEMTLQGPAEAWDKEFKPLADAIIASIKSK